MTISVGDTIPDINIATMGEQGPQPISTAEFFAGKKVVLFSVPGAFTPTCSAKHLPGFIENAQAFFDKGVDTIACMSVNDAFVMGAWGKSQSADGKVVMLADGNGDFSKAMGLEMDASGFGMGIRGKRFSMIVNDGKVEAVNVEDPGAFHVSSAEHTLSQL